MADESAVPVDPRKARDAGRFPALRGLLIGRPETGALFGAIVIAAPTAQSTATSGLVS